MKTKNFILPIIIMVLLFGMIGFVTNIAAPAGTIWMNQYEGSDFIGMLGNLMNFMAYLIMGIPAGLLLQKIGYRKTAIAAISAGLLGVLIQFVSGKFTGDTGLVVYLIGAFVAGFSMCMLNTVVNPMLNTMGGGGKKGSVLLQLGGGFNSLLGTIAPIFVGAMIGQVTKDTVFSDINPVLYIAMVIFALALLVLIFVRIPEPEEEAALSTDSKGKGLLSYRHFVLGVIGIFIYVGVEVGIPGTMKFWLENLKENALLPDAAGSVAATYWFLMLVGRLAGAGISAGIGSRKLLAFASLIAILLVAAAMILPTTVETKMPVFSNFSFALQIVPISALLLVLVGLCTSVMWGGIFNLAVEGLGKYTKKASGIFMMMVVGGGILPLLQSGSEDWTSNYQISYLVPLAGLVYLFFYAIWGSKVATEKK